MEEASREGKTPGVGERSRTVMVVAANSGRVVRARAVESPKTPEPTMRTEEGMAVVPLALEREKGGEQELDSVYV